MPLDLIIEKSLQINTGLIIDEINDSQIFTNKIFAHSSLLQAMIYKFTLE